MMALPQNCPEICPDEPSNIPSLFAVEAYHALQSVRVKDEAPLNILPMLITPASSSRRRGHGEKRALSRC